MTEIPVPLLVLLAALAAAGLVGVGLWAGRRGAPGRDAAAATSRAHAEQARAQAEHQERMSAAWGDLRGALRRVETQVHTLERDRAEQFGQVGEHLVTVAGTTAGLRDQTAALVGALSSSGIRGTWGEAQLRRVLEHAGMLEHCDFEEQVSAVSAHDARVRPDVLVHLPGGKSLVIDAKAPLTAFLRAHGDGLTEAERTQARAHHAAAVRRHVDSLADKAYWTAFTSAPEFVVCFVPGDAVLAAALQSDPSLYDHAQGRRVVLASPATLLALLRSVAYGWQQAALTDNARDLLRIGQELHQRLGTVGTHLTAMGSALRRSVETYNSLVGSLESRVLVTSRRMAELGVVEDAVPAPPPVQATPRPLTAPELLDAVADPRPGLLEEADHTTTTWAPGTSHAVHERGREAG